MKDIIMSNIKVNKQEWDSLSQETQKTITETLRSSGSLRDNSQIIGDENTPATNGEVNNETLQEPLTGACETACNVAKIAANKACSLLPWPASTICKTTANAAYNVCIDYCKI